MKLALIAVAAAALGYVAGRIGSRESAKDWVFDRFPADPDAALWWQQPFLFAALWMLNPILTTRRTYRWMRGRPVVEPTVRLPAPPINPRWAAPERGGEKE